MALPYKKWTEDDIKNRNISDEGDYPFKIISIVLKNTKVQLDERGQPKPTHKMLEIDFEFHDVNGIVKKIKDWIVFCEGMDWKLRHLANTTGTLELYEMDELETHHLERKHGVFKLGIKEAEYQGEKRKQNYVKDYVKKILSAPIGNQDNNFSDDDIPL